VLFEQRSPYAIKADEELANLLMFFKKGFLKGS
jgi:hypothetical protein